MTPAQGNNVTDPEGFVLWRENQRISLRAFLRTLLHNPQIAQTKAIQDFLTRDPMTPHDEDVEDILRRKAVDERRIQEQKKFYDIARKRAAELDVYMEQYGPQPLPSELLSWLHTDSDLGSDKTLWSAMA